MDFKSRKISVEEKKIRYISADAVFERIGASNKKEKYLSLLSLAGQNIGRKGDALLT